MGERHGSYGRARNDDEIEFEPGYSAHFELAEHPWHAPVIVYDDGQAKLNPHLLRPDRPVMILFEGTVPNEEQLEACRALWNALANHMQFNMATFCPTLLNHCHHIMVPHV